MAPFAGYEDFDACVRANSDKDDPEAYCAAIKREVEGDSSLSAEEQEHYRRLSAAGTRALAEFRNPGDIERLDTADGVRYKHVMLLSPGTWTDAGSEQTVDYTPEGIRASAENFIDLEALTDRVPDWGMLSNGERADRLADLGDEVLADAVPLNLLHGPAMYGTDSLDEVGEIPTDSIIVDDDGRLYGDLVMHGDSPQSETAIELMDEVLEAAQDPGTETPPVGPSVEIPADRVTERDGVLALEEAWFTGVGVVFNPASRPVELGTQARNRAVAMTAATDDAEGVIHRAMQTGAVHRPRFNGTTTSMPEETPGPEEFNDAALEDVADHAIASASGFPPDDFDDVLGFVVDPVSGDLSLPLMREVAQDLAAAELGDTQAFTATLDPATRAEAREQLVALATENFGEAIGEELTADADDIAEADADTDADDEADEETALADGITKATPRHRRRMGDTTEFDPEDLNDEELARTLETMQEDLSAIERALQDIDMVQDLVEQAEAEGFDSSEQTVADLVEFVQGEMDVDDAAMQELQDATDAFLQTVEAESLDAVSAEAMRDWLAETGAAEENGEGEEGEADEDEQAMTMEDVQELKESLGEFASHMSDIKEMLTAHEERVEEVDRRLTEIEEEPQQRALTGDSPDEFHDSVEATEADGEHEDLLL